MLVVSSLQQNTALSEDDIYPEHWHCIHYTLVSLVTLYSYLCVPIWKIIKSYGQLRPVNIMLMMVVFSVFAVSMRNYVV